MTEHLHCLDQCEKAAGVPRTEPSDGWHIEWDSLGYYVCHLTLTLSGPFTWIEEARREQEELNRLVCYGCGAPFVPCTIFSCPGHV